jgi:hypothetical protein
MNTLLAMVILTTPCLSVGSFRADRQNVVLLSVGVASAREIALASVGAVFNTGERYRRRLNKALQIEQEGVKE